MHRRVATFALAAALVASFTFSQIADAKPAVAVLRVDAVLTGAKTDAKAAVVSNKLTQAIRQATRERGPYRLAPNTNKDLLELKLLYNCSSEAPACMSKIGKSMKSARLLWGKLAHKGDHYLVTVNLLNVKRKAMLRSSTVRIPMAQANTAGLRRWGRTLYNRLTGLKDHGRLHIVANSSSGVVLIDGNPATNLKNGAADVSGLSAGAHELEIKADGFKPYTETVTVEGGKKTTVNATLAAKAAPILVKKDPPKPGKPGGFSRVMFWATAAVTVIAGVGGTVARLQYNGDLKTKQIDAIKLLRIEQDITLDANNACADAAMRGAVAQSVIDACDEGKSRASLASVLAGVSVVSALAAGFFYYKGFIASGSSTNKESNTVGKSRIRVIPNVGPGHVGAGLSLEF